MKIKKQEQWKLPHCPTVYKPTNDDWHPCYPENTVELKYIGKLSDGRFRVAVWGADDTGYERDFDKEEDAISMFQRLEKYPMINYADMHHLGFWHV